MEKILVATDGSDNSERALIEAKKYAEYLDGEVTILTIVETLGRYTTIEYQPKDLVEELETEGQRILEDSLKIFGDFKGQVKTKLRKGNSADEILKEAKEGDYDLIVMGSRGLGTFSRAMLGSVSSRVLNHIDMDVLIIK